ncbi:SGNH/GDSL hydrolase family protein [candidate division KSB1 bacterium]
MKEPISRREFMRRGAAASVVGVGAVSLGFPGLISAADEERAISAKEYLDELLYTKEEVKSWLAGEAFPFARYSSEFGWLLPDANFRDGIDGSVSSYTYEKDDGPRITINHRDKPCRINTYGDSFTQCHQVNDEETWQEVLAAHIREPVRNFGIGGWSVYQAYRRMLTEEKRTPAEYIIFNIYDDDHLRNLDSWRTIRVRKHVRFTEPPLPHVKVNVQRDTFEEFPNPCPTPESLYNLCDREWVHKRFGDDFVLQIMVARRNARLKQQLKSYSDFNRLAAEHGLDIEVMNNVGLDKTAVALHQSTALRSTEKIVEKIEAFAKANGKKVLYVLSFPAGSMASLVRTRERWDQSFVDFLKMKGLPFVDMMEYHMAEFRQFDLDIDDYLKRYYIGHYNPRGNLFCAFAMKNKLVEMLDPKPFPYREDVIKRVLE